MFFFALPVMAYAGLLGIVLFAHQSKRSHPPAIERWRSRMESPESSDLVKRIARNRIRVLTEGLETIEHQRETVAPYLPWATGAIVAFYSVTLAIWLLAR